MSPSPKKGRRKSRFGDWIPSSPSLAPACGGRGNFDADRSNAPLKDTATEKSNERGGIAPSHPENTLSTRFQVHTYTADQNANLPKDAMAECSEAGVSLTPSEHVSEHVDRVELLPATQKTPSDATHKQRHPCPPDLRPGMQSEEGWRSIGKECSPTTKDGFQGMTAKVTEYTESKTCQTSSQPQRKSNTHGPNAKPSSFDQNEVNRREASESKSRTQRATRATCAAGPVVDKSKTTSAPPVKTFNVGSGSLSSRKSHTDHRQGHKWPRTLVTANTSVDGNPKISIDTATKRVHHTGGKAMLPARDTAVAKIGSKTANFSPKDSNHQVYMRSRSIERSTDRPAVSEKSLKETAGSSKDLEEGLSSRALTRAASIPMEPLQRNGESSKAKGTERLPKARKIMTTGLRSFRCAPHLYPPVTPAREHRKESLDRIDHSRDEAIRPISERKRCIVEPKPNEAGQPKASRFGHQSSPKLISNVEMANTSMQSLPSKHQEQMENRIRLRDSRASDKAPELDTVVGVAKETPAMASVSRTSPESKTVPHQSESPLEKGETSAPDNVLKCCGDDQGDLSQHDRKQHARKSTEQNDDERHQKHSEETLDNKRKEDKRQIQFIAEDDTQITVSVKNSELDQLFRPLHSKCQERKTGKRGVTSESVANAKKAATSVREGGHDKAPNFVPAPMHDSASAAASPQEPMHIEPPLSNFGAPPINRLGSKRPNTARHDSSQSPPTSKIIAPAITPPATHKAKAQLQTPNTGTRDEDVKRYLTTEQRAAKVGYTDLGRTEGDRKQRTETYNALTSASVAKGSGPSRSLISSPKPLSENEELREPLGKMKTISHSAALNHELQELSEPREAGKNSNNGSSSAEEELPKSTRGDSSFLIPRTARPLQPPRPSKELSPNLHTSRLTKRIGKPRKQERRKQMKLRTAKSSPLSNAALQGSRRREILTLSDKNHGKEAALTTPAKTSTHSEPSSRSGAIPMPPVSPTGNSSPDGQPKDFRNGSIETRKNVSSVLKRTGTHERRAEVGENALSAQHPPGEFLPSSNDLHLRPLEDVVNDIMSVFISKLESPLETPGLSGAPK